MLTLLTHIAELAAPLLWLAFVCAGGMACNLLAWVDLKLGGIGRER